MYSFTNSGRVTSLLEKTAKDSRHWDLSSIHIGKRPLVISFLNAHAINNAVTNTEFFEFLMSSDYLLRDGIGIKLALQLFNLPETDNLNGTDLISRIIPLFKESKIAIFGASNEALEACRLRLQAEGVQNIVAMEHGFHNDEVYINACSNTSPELVLLCMGMPRQELLAARLRQNGLGGILICGGGWADFYSGIKIRAPEWVRRYSLEWLHRLWREPRRLGKRYTIDILYYFLVIFTARLRYKKQSGNA